MPVITLHAGSPQILSDPPPGYAKGLIPRDFSQHPVGCYAAAPPFPDNLLIGKSEWSDRLQEQKKSNARMIDVRNRGMHGQPIPSRDQNGKGFCWAHSSVSAMLLTRAVQGEPYVDLSAYMVACIIKHYKDQGGFGAESLQFISENGVPTSQYWPQQSMSKSNDTPEMRANAKLHRYVEWFDMEPRNLDQFVSAMLLGYAVVSDFNWWGHSVCSMCLENIGTTVDSLESWILNSWSDSWSANGAGKLKGSHALPDSMIAARVGTPSET